MKSLWLSLRRLAPYLTLALLVPGGSVLAVLLWLARHKQDAQAQS